MGRPYSIGIAGCGIGGLTAAAFLRDQGHSVTLFDRFETPAPVGSGLVLQPVGLECLKRLSLADHVISKGRRIYRMEGIESGSRRTVLKVDYGPRDGPAFGLAIHRAELFGALYETALKRGASFIGGATVTGSTLNDDGRYLETETGNTFGPFDLVIDGTGAHSQLSPIKVSALPYGALWGTVAWPKASPLPNDRLSQCYRGAHHMLGVLPLGHNNQTAIFWSEPEDRLEPWFLGDLQKWRDSTITLWPEFAPFVEQITDPAQMSAAIYRHGTLRTPYEDHLAFIGDAAHQTSPQLGQGANMALLDATVLAEALKQHDIPKALKSYARRRKAHVRTYQLISTLFTPFYQSDSSVLPIIRNHVYHPVSQTWPISRLLTRLVSGSLVPTGA